MRGTRDEGILNISAYRVSQKKGANAGPFAAYSQQVDNMIKKGDLGLDPRTRILLMMTGHTLAPKHSGHF